ncbi:hypothetical protein OPQ81_006801 [Rhizoctonia solani]|nr:hypothetical protein OPQ81_006801 [Rhizoctonia solani]
MAKRVEKVLLKVGHPDLEQENAIESDEVEWTEARFQRATKTKEHIETYLPWLFGRQDVPSRETAQDTPTRGTAQASSTLPTSPSTDSPTTVITPGALCSTCANCPTCRLKPPDPPSTKSSGIEVRTQPIPSKDVDLGDPLPADIASSKTHTVDSNIVPAQRNEQMFSPPGSPELRLNLQVPAPGIDIIMELSDRPNKRLRADPLTSSSRNSTAIVKQLAETDFPPTLLLTPQIRAPLSENPTTLGDSRDISRRSSMPNNKAQTHNIHHAQITTKLSPDICLPPDSRKPNDRAIASPQTMSSSTSATPDPVPLSESDTRERRRISKVKERDIRAQLAKLSPRIFSSAGRNQVWK